MISIINRHADVTKKGVYIAIATGYNTADIEIYVYIFKGVLLVR